MLIGLHGKKQAGKDTVHRRIAHLLGPGSTTGAAVERVSFADKLYESAAAALGVAVRQLQEFKANAHYRVQVAFDDGARRWTYGDITVREYLQNYGTEAHRSIFGDNFWVDNVDLQDHEDKIVVVTDVRFQNEAKAVTTAGGWIVHVLGPDDVESAGDGHASEEKLPGYLIDQHLLNTQRDDDFRALDDQVLDLMLYLIREERRQPSSCGRIICPPTSDCRACR